MPLLLCLACLRGSGVWGFGSGVYLQVSIYVLVLEQDLNRNPDMKENQAIMYFSFLASKGELSSDPGMKSFKLHI